MNTTNLKKYAPQARRDFMAAVSQRLNQFGIHSDSKGKLTVSTPVVSGSVMQIEGLSFDAGLARAREKLVQRAEQMGFEALVEQMAYTWFNRLSAIRYMELHGYLEHNLRVLSHPDKANSFEILDHAQDVATDLGLDRNHIVELKLAGNKDEELYRTLLLGQCHQLHQAMPFLFEALDDETELLLPDNLTRTDSILRGLVDSIPEDDWQPVEIIGWLYQFYISEKKDQVIGSVVKSEDIPAATQLFTPNWIVKYLVQNSVGRQWLMTYPDSGLKARMEYYIEPAEQEPSVVEALAAITPTSIDPETLKVLDPACGSGHILVEAYDILKAIYEERGYRVRDIPKLILEKNLYGLDIDDRAAQLAGFALLMKARADDRRIFTRDIKLNVLAIQSTQNLDQPDLWLKLALNQDAKRGSMESIFDDVQSNLADTVDDIEFKQLRAILALFEQAKTLGSLIQVPHEQAEFLRSLTSRLQELAEQGDTMQKPAAMTLLPYVYQACLLVEKYDAVLANPPYLGGKSMNNILKDFSKKVFPDSRSDLFAIFIQRCAELGIKNGSIGLVTPFTWMFISSHEKTRRFLFNNQSIDTLVKPSYTSFFESAIVSLVAFTIQKSVENINGTYIDLGYLGSAESQPGKLLAAINSTTSKIKHTACKNDFEKIPGSPLAYWIGDNVRKLFVEETSLGEIAASSNGIQTGNNAMFVREWFEISHKDMHKKWIPYNKGGAFRKWYGNFEHVVNWNDEGKEIKQQKNSCIRGEEYYFKEGITWSDVTSGSLSCRYMPSGFLFDASGPAAFFKTKLDLLNTLALLNTQFSDKLSKILNPTMHFQSGDFRKLPSGKKLREFNIEQTVLKAIDLSKSDWNLFELSWDFAKNPILKHKQDTIDESYRKWQAHNADSIFEMLSLEQEQNQLFIEAYELQHEFTADVPLEKITLTVNPKYRYSGNQSDEELVKRFQSDTFAELISFSIGCMMGRYSLDEPGLIYAHAGNVDFDLSRYPSFPADEDGILPLTDQEWFKDDATNRFREFLVAVWGEDTLQQNLEFVAESLGLSSFKPKKGETSLDTVRRYLSNQFYKDHLQTYKKRPIYWLFSSGKQNAFECLVYLHRYNDSTLARMRTEYVTPLLGKYSAYADQLSQQLQDASSSEATRIKKDIQALEKKQTELRQFDDKLKHYADMRIKIDLDDGIKVNYGKFGDLLAEVKAITGGPE